MRKQKKNNLDLPLNHIRVKFSLAAFFVVGGVTGVLVLRFLTPEDAESLCLYLSDYIKLVQLESASVSYLEFIWESLRLFLAAWLLSFVFWGVFGFPILFLERGFFLAYGAACFWKVFGAKGLVFAGVLFGVPSLLWAPALFLIGVSGFVRAQQRFYGPTCRDRYFWWRTLFALGLIVLCILAECLVIPVLLRSVVLFFLHRT